MTEELIIEITPTGIKVEASGFTGDKCIKTQEELENFLTSKGINIGKRDQKRKLEQMYSTSPGTTIQR
jgi:hypothetical protein